MVLATWGLLAHAGPAIDLTTGLAGITAAPSTAGTLGLAGVSVWPGERVSVDLRGHTGLLAGPTREVTGLSVGARLFLSDAVFLRADLVHQHETPWGAFSADPVMTMIGSGDSIGHGSGLDGGGGVRAAADEADRGEAEESGTATID